MCRKEMDLEAGPAALRPTCSSRHRKMGLLSHFIDPTQALLGGKKQLQGLGRGSLMAIQDLPWWNPRPPRM